MKNFIAGELAEPQSAKYTHLIDPCTGRKRTVQVPQSDLVDLIPAIAAAKKSQGVWDLKERIDFCVAVGDAILKNTQELASMESQDVGKPLVWATKDIKRAAQNLHYFASLAQSCPLQHYPSPDGYFYEILEPHGVCALITPWNYPLHLLTWKLAPALLMNNSIICKPSEHTPSTAFWLAKCLKKLSIPKGVCNIIFGDAHLSACLVEHPGVAMTSFTGSTATGLKVRKASLNEHKPVCLEMGGKNAAVILKDADIGSAVDEILRGAYVNSGQVCLALSRIYVQESIEGEFCALFREKMQLIELGDLKRETTFMGPLAHGEQYKKVRLAIEQAAGESKIFCGGVFEGQKFASLEAFWGLLRGTEYEGGWWVPPVLAQDMSRCSILWQREIFGPLALVQTFKYPFEAAELVSSTPYALCASVFGKNPSPINKLIPKLKVGTLWVNAWGLRDPRVPFGGLKHSGLGLTGGLHSLHTYSRKRTVYVPH